MKLRCRTSLYTLIQLVSILSLSTLAQSQARQAPTTTEPPLRLEVGSARPGDSERVLQVILSNVSADLVDPAKYSLVYREKDGKPFVIHCKNTKGKSIEVAPGQFLPLTELLGTEMLSIGKGSNGAFQLTLVPGNGVSHAALTLSIEDAQGNSVSKPLSVTWRAKPFWTTKKIFTYVAGALATLAVLGGVIRYFRGDTPPAGPDFDPNLEESSGCSDLVRISHTLAKYHPANDRGKTQLWRGNYESTLEKGGPSAEANTPSTSQPQKGQSYLSEDLASTSGALEPQQAADGSPRPEYSAFRAGSTSSRQQDLPLTEDADTASSQKNASSPEDSKPSTPSRQPGPPSLETDQRSASSAADSSPGEPATGTETCQPGPPLTETSKEAASSAVDSLSRSRASSSTYQTASEHASESPAQDDLNDCMLVDTAKEQNEAIIKLGLALLKQIYASNTGQHFELSLQNVCDLINFLYAKAEAKKQAFTEGAYVVDDSEEKLFEALKSIPAVQNLDDRRLKYENLSYSRWSSHSIGKKDDQSEHYGIDFAQTATLHSHIKHLLFFSFKGLDGEKKLFLKPEKHGVNISDFANHAWDYLLTTLMRESGMTNGHDAAYRKERLKSLCPYLQNDLGHLKTMLRYKLDNTTYRKLEDNIKLFGLSYIYLCCDILLKQYTSESAQQVGKPENKQKAGLWPRLTSFVRGQRSPTSTQDVTQSLHRTKLTAKEQPYIALLKEHLEDAFDHIEYRMGREVSFDLGELGISTPEQMIHGRMFLKA